ncbi:SDR family NAD(P)-dependent oxidoreductase [Sanguibacter sp. A247]|uniref:SDR family NAD(P)-dependent oxidoreductase n=1 Tax=unclassified Sanguibacter TaxID=2645534 RepID=UPI003FD8B322
MSGLEGRVCLVTGGSRGLGLGAARALARAGATVVITGRDGDATHAVARGLTGGGLDVRGVALDVTDDGSIARAVGSVLDDHGRIDVLVNNAGGGSGSSPAWLPDRSARDIRSSIEVNLVGPILVTRAVIPSMIEQRSGSIVSIASVAGHVGRDRRLYTDNGMLGQPVDYAAAKAGIAGLTRDLAGMLGPYGVRANAISPGGFRRDNLPDGFVRDYADRTALGRMGEEDRDGYGDLDGAVVFLAGPASAYVTGQDLVVDGGFGVFR